jgi:hypothetical protein
MIEAKGPCEAPCVERWFLGELKNIDLEFRPFFDLKARRWLIVRFLPVAEKVTPGIIKTGYIIEYCVSKGKDYTPLDRRTIYALQIIIYLKNKLRVIDEHLKELKESDDQLGREGVKDWMETRRQFLKKLYGFMFTETFT